MRAWVVATLAAQRVMALAGWFLGCAAVLGVTDYLLRLPEPLRVVLWVGGLGALAWVGYAWLAPLARFRPSLTTLALRLERTPAGRAAGLADRLASAVELAGHGGVGVSRVVSEAASGFARAYGRASRQVIERGRLRRSSAALVGVACLIAGAFLAWPVHSTAAARRVLTPWSGMEYPRRTQILDVTGLAAHPRGQAVPLRAVVSSTTNVRDDVRVYFRVVGPRGPTPWRTMLLNAQGSVGAAPMSASPLPSRSRGTLFEGLVEPAAEAAPPDAELALEYWFQADDNRTDFGRVILASPPAVSSATVEVSPPAYASADLASSRDLLTGSQTLSVGADERSVAGPILAGSRVTLRLELSKEVPTPTGGGLDEALFLASAFPADLPPDFSASFESRAWTVWFTLERSLALPVVLVDRHGIRSDDRTSFRLEAVSDQPPSAAVTLPTRDQSVLASAVVEARAEGRDDVGLERVELLWQRHRPESGTGSRAPVPIEEPRVASLAEPEPGSGSQASAEAVLDLAAMEVSPGDEVWILARARDRHESGGERRGATVSRPRRLRIISESELVEQLRAELAVVRRVAAQAEADQRRLMRDRDEPDAEREARDARAQEALGERLAPAVRLLEELKGRLEQNRLGDEGVSGVIERSREALAQAGEASERAANALAEAGSPRREEGERRRLAREALAEQEAVREALARALDALDQGQEGWLARRALERLLDEQRRLEQQTREAGERTAGRSAEQLSPEERRLLERLAQQQEESAQRSEQAASQLSEAAQRVGESDRALSEALRRAAEQARQAQLSRQQRQAAEQIRRNQPGQARQHQQQSRETLEQMLRELERASRRRDEVLARQLTDLIEAIEGLIRSQESEIAALAEGMAGRGAEPADAGMRTLHRQTLAVAEEAASGAGELASVAPTLRWAGESQARAVASLRRAPPDFAGADPHERESLQHLTRAHAEARELLSKARERDLRRRRADLAGEYARALEEQRGITAETEPLVGRELSRRDRLAARLAAQRQETLRTSLEEMRERTSDLAEATVFVFAHRRIDSASRSASASLERGEATPGVLRDQHAVETILAGLIEALRNPEDDNPFREEESGGGGSGSGGGPSDRQPLVPELAELRLLRLMQQEAAERTRLLSEPDRRADAEEAERVAQLQRDLADHARGLLERMMQSGGGRRPSRGSGETAP